MKAGVWVKEVLKRIAPEVHTIFKHLHANPEISWNEYKTSAFIKDKLDEMGIDCYLFSDTPGVIAEIGSGDHAVALRSDIDALWQEVDGSFKANHSCGHDAHMSMVLGTILLLKESGVQFNRKLKFIFQPAEEKAEGALAMVDKGVMDDVEYLYGVHLRPIQEAAFGQAAGAIKHGAGQFIKGTIIGTDTHAARPHLGKSGIEVGASLIHQLNSIEMPLGIPYSVNMTNFHAGENQHNTVPGRATFALDLRAQTNEVMEELKNKVQYLVQKEAELFNVDIKLEKKGYFVAAEVNEHAKYYMDQAIIETLGEKNLLPAIQSPGGEDFHFYTLRNPNIKATMLGLGCDLTPGLHHPQMNFNDEALMTGVEILARCLIETCKA